MKLPLPWPFRDDRHSPSGNWRQAGPMDLPLVAGLCRLNEPLAMNLLDNFFQVRQGNLLPWKHDWWEHFMLSQPGNGAVQACLGLSANGYLHSLAAPGQPEPDWAAGLASLARHTPRLGSRLFGGILCGTSAGALAGLIKRSVRSRKDYLVLALPGPDSGTGSGSWPPEHPAAEFRDLAQGLLYRAATRDDARFMLDIQCAYEVEEVLCSTLDLDSWQTLARLEIQLKKHRVYLAQTASEAVAKAGTNALSWGYAQIGGVYTAPIWRNKGVARQLVSLLVEECRSCGLGTCLFVKQDNLPARRVYDWLGFEACGELQIVYFS